MSLREEDLRQHRLDIRKKLISSGKNPYPQETHRTHSSQSALAQPMGSAVTIAGRITSSRGHGKIRFIDLNDESGIIQVVIKEDEVTNYLAINDIGISDFIRVAGKRYLTNSGQESVLAQSFELISKSIRVLPEGWDNKITNKETQYRKRTVDLAISPEKRELFRKRSRIISSVRDTLVTEGYLEVETPTVQPQYGGANARPFMTHINAWNIDMYLRISDELYLKKIIMGGFDKVFEITKDFRNEGVDKTHNPEFTMMECYSAYSDYTDMMTLTENIYRNAAIAANGTAIIEYEGVEIDLSKPWRRLTMKNAMREYLEIDVDSLSDDELKKAIKKYKLKYEGEWIRGLGIATLFEALEEKLIQPVFIMDFPKETTSLCKLHRDDPTLIERFEPYIVGWEVGNAYTELNDPVLQRTFWAEERKDDPEAHPLDENFIEAMEYGMPPTGGLGLGMDRLTMLLTNQKSIKDVIFFPTMKPIT